MAATESLTAAQLDRFRDHGFVVVDDFFEPGETDAFRRVLQRVIRAYLERAEASASGRFPTIRPGEETDRGMIELAAFDRAYFDAIYDTVWKTPEWLRMVSSPAIETISNQLMGRDVSAPLYGFINRCRFTLPRDERSRLGWHQEIFQTIPGANFVQIWAPMVHDATPDTGPVQFCVGSHRDTMQKPPWKENARGVSKVEFGPKITDRYCKAVMTLSVGQAVFFTGRLLHRSGENTSGRVRYAMVGLFHDVQDANFHPPKMAFSYRNRTSREYFDSLPDEY